MKLFLLHGPPDSGKLTIARQVAARTGMALFHNHLVVDAVAALFPFGSTEFVRLREQIWLELLTAAAIAGRDTIFTYAPEATVSAGFIPDLLEMLRKHGAMIRIVALTVSGDVQTERLANTDRHAFGKLTDTALLETLRESMASCSAAMPESDLTIDTGATAPDVAARAITALLANG